MTKKMRTKLKSASCEEQVRILLVLVRSHGDLGLILWSTHPTPQRLVALMILRCDIILGVFVYFHFSEKQISTLLIGHKYNLYTHN